MFVDNFMGDQFVSDSYYKLPVVHGKAKPKVVRVFPVSFDVRALDRFRRKQELCLASLVFYFCKSNTEKAHSYLAFGKFSEMK